MVTMTLLGMIVGALCFRIRGDALVGELVGGPASHIGRLIWALPLATVALAANPDWRLLALIPALFIGAIPGWYDGISISAARMAQFPKHLGIMTLRGVFWTGPAGLVMWWAGVHWQFGLIGAIAGPIYFLASVLDDDLKIGPLWISDHDGFVNVPLAEILFGMVCGGAIVIGCIA